MFLSTALLHCFVTECTVPLNQSVTTVCQKKSVATASILISLRNINVRGRNLRWFLDRIEPDPIARISSRSNMCTAVFALTREEAHAHARGTASKCRRASAGRKISAPLPRANRCIGGLLRRWKRDRTRRTCLRISISRALLLSPTTTSRRLSSFRSVFPRSVLSGFRNFPVSQKEGGLDLTSQSTTGRRPVASHRGNSASAYQRGESRREMLSRDGQESALERLALLAFT